MGDCKNNVQTIFGSLDLIQKTKVSDNIKISTCATDIDSISSLLQMEFIFKWPITERPRLPISERQDGDEVVHTAIYLDFLS